VAGNANQRTVDQMSETGTIAEYYWCKSSWSTLRTHVKISALRPICIAGLQLTTLRHTAQPYSMDTYAATISEWLAIPYNGQTVQSTCEPHHVCSPVSQSSHRSEMLPRVARGRHSSRPVSVAMCIRFMQKVCDLAKVQTERKSRRDTHI
jgi:hypothetical protein